MKKRCIGITAIVFSAVSILMAQEALSAREILDSTAEVSKLKGSESVSTLTIIDSKGRERVRKVAQVSKLYDNGDTEKKLVRFLAPADVKGTGLLTYDYENKDDDMWLYMPALRKTRRIVSSEKSKSFMGSEFSYADMTPPPLDDFTLKLLGEKTVGGVNCWEIEMTPKNDDIAEENGFSRKITCIAHKDFVVRKSIYYDLDGELHKEFVVEEVQEVDTENNKYRPVKLYMENKQNGRKSVLEVEKIESNPGVKDDYFTVRYLERA